MKINQIKNELDELWDVVEKRRPDKSLNWLGYWFGRWHEAYDKGDEAIKELLKEVNELLKEKGDDGVLELMKALLVSCEKEDLDKK